jgi:uncharacterized protein (DUF4213/DUF364 family)
MNMLRDLINNLDKDAPVRSVLVGAHWTVVCSRHCGMAATLMSNFPHGLGAVRNAGDLHSMTAVELAQYAFSDNFLEASIGVAAINSLLEVDEDRTVEVNAVDVLAEYGKGRNVALIGHFPFIPKLRPSVGQLWVIEQRPTEGEWPAEAARDIIPEAEVVAITSSTVINHTIDQLLDLCRSNALVMMLGPSTPLSPALFEHGVSILAGSKVVDEGEVLRTVGQGAKFQQVKGVRLVTLER